MKRSRPVAEDMRDFLPQRTRESSQFGGLPLLDAGSTPDQPTLNLQTPVPVAPGSLTSELAAADVDLQRELRRVLIWFAAQSEPRTRHECAAALYEHLGVGAIGPACGRVNQLVFLECLAEVGREGKRATLSITSKGFAKAAMLVRAA